MQQPSLTQFYDIEQERLRARLDGLRFVISHAGEKGRVLENEVLEFTRAMLPSEYGLSTGFIAHYEDGRVILSPQLDIIIYDAVRCAPLVSFGTCGVFPLEAVYGYVEVKARLDSSTLSECISQNISLRRLTQRNFWELDCGSPPTTTLRSRPWLPVRAFAFFFESHLGTGLELAQKLQNALGEASQARPHIHGMFVVGHGFFSPHHIADDSDSLDTGQQNFFLVETNALAAFKVMLFRCLATFPRYEVESSPAIDRYHGGVVSYR